MNRRTRVKMLLITEWCWLFNMLVLLSSCDLIQSSCDYVLCACYFGVYAVSFTVIVELCISFRRFDFDYKLCAHCVAGLPWWWYVSRIPSTVSSSTSCVRSTSRTSSLGWRKAQAQYTLLCWWIKQIENCVCEMWTWWTVIAFCKLNELCLRFCDCWIISYLCLKCFF